MACTGNLEVARCGGGDIHGRRSSLCALDVWTRKVSWQAQGIVRMRVVVEVNVAMTLGLACERAGMGKLLVRAA